MVISQAKSPFLTMSVPMLAKPAMSFIVWTWNQWFGSLCQKSFYPTYLNRLLEKKEILGNIGHRSTDISTAKELVFKDKIGRDRHDRRKRIVDTKKWAIC